ncbi:MAG: hypothetical protein AABW54_04205 [Candidatus Micrarchaeota archaeon]
MLYWQIELDKQLETLNATRASNNAKAIAAENLANQHAKSAAEQMLQARRKELSPLLKEMGLHETPPERLREALQQKLAETFKQRWQQA